MKKIFLILVLFSSLAVRPGWTDEAKLNVVATQTIFADLVQEVGGDKVNVTAIANPKYNIHFIQPRPSDVRKVSKADLYFNGGLDLEAWSDPLLEAAGNPKLFRHAQNNVDLSVGIRLLEVPDHPASRSEGDIHLYGNPHFHMSPENAKVMVGTILEKLKETDPANADYYETNAKKFLTKLDRKISEWERMCAGCRGKEIISYHKDIAYFADFLGLKADEFLEPKPGIPPTPKHIQFLEDYTKTHKVKAIVLPTYYSHKQADKLASRVGAKVVTICQGAGELPGTEDFFDFFDHNVKAIAETLQ